MASRKPAQAASQGQTKTASRGQAKAGGSAARTGSRNGTAAVVRTGRAATASAATGSAATGSAATGRAATSRAATAAQGSRRPGQDSRRPGQDSRRPGQDSRRPGQDNLSPVKAPTRYVPPLWFQITTLVLSVGGLGVSVYLTIAHYTSSSILACSDTGTINCAKVTTSAESVVFGIFPVAVLGLAFYVVMTALNTPWAWRWQQPAIPWLRTIGIISGLGFVLYLVYAEVIEIGNICLWCTSVHGITFLLFVLLMCVAPFVRPSSAAAR